MSKPEDLPSPSQKPIAAFLPLSVVLSLVIFVGTYFTYFSRHLSETPGSYLPLSLGIGLFFALMSWFNYLVISSPSVRVRLAKAGGMALAESAVFLFLLMFLLLNTVGS